MSSRNRLSRALRSVGVCSALALVLAVGEVSAAPSVSSFTATPSLVPATGGVVTLAASVADAATCRFASTPAVTGLPVTVPCASGSASLDVTLPANASTTPRVYTFRLTATQPGSGSVQATPALVTVEATPPPAVTQFTATPSLLPSTGGAVELSASVTNAATCRFASTPAVAGLPVTLPCATGSASTSVTLPANLSLSARTYTFRLTASRPQGGSVQPAPAVVTVEPTPPPSVIEFVASPTHLPPAGGVVDLSASAANAATCRFTSTPAIPGLPLVLPCDTGSASTSVTLPANTTGNPRVYTIRVTAARPGAGSAQTSLTATVATASDLTDLAVWQTDSPDPVQIGGTLTYTVSVQNNGPDQATGVTLLDTLPSDVTFLYASPTHGTGCSESAGIVSCNLGILASSEIATVYIAVQPTAIGTISNTAEVSGHQTDVVGTNDSSIEPTLVERRPKIVFLNDGFPADQGLWTMDPNGANNVRIVAGPTSDAVLSPDGSKIVYQKQNPTTFDWELWVVGVDGSDDHFLFAAPSVTASWHADSTKVIFSAYVEVQPGSFASKAVVVNVTGTPDPQLLLPGEAPPTGELAPAYSPDGQWVIFRDTGGRPAPGTSRFHIVAADGLTPPVPFDQTPYGDRGVVWSPGGQWFYFASGFSTIYRASTDPQAQSSQIVTSDLAEGPTRWAVAPQGDRIAFTTRLNVSSPVTAVVNGDGTGYLQLTTPYAGAAPAGCYSPVWSPDGADVLMHCYPGSGAISIYKASSTAPAPQAPTFIGGQFRSREPVFAGLRPTR